jgi:septum formation protein
LAHHLPEEKKFEVLAPDIEESSYPTESPLQFTKRISKEKAKSIAKLFSNSASTLIISCDTVVNLNNQIIGKPLDFQDAINKITLLNGKQHEVITSITLLIIDNGQSINITDSEITQVKFKNLNQYEIVDYITKINYLDKAGAYAIQEHGNLLVASINGSTTNVIGFPLRLFFKMLTKLNLLEKILIYN